MRAAASAGPAPLLAARGLRHRFGATQALAGVDLDLREREILGVVGGGASGKSTLIGALGGLFAFDEGETVFRSFPIRLRSRRDAVRIGIAVVGQRPRLVPDLDVFDNVVLPLLGRPAQIEPPDMRRRVASLLDSIGGPDAPALAARASRLTSVQVWLVAVVRALASRAKLYLFDEPFADLSARDADALAGVMGRLRMAGCGLIVAARRLVDLVPLADRVLVLDAGVGVLTASARTTEGQESLRQAIRSPQEAAVEPTSRRQRYRLEVAGLDADGVRDVSFGVAAGEVVAVHGLRGAGCATLAEAVAGVTPRRSGSVKVDLTDIPTGSPRAAARSGLAFCGPEARPPLPDASGLDNLALIAPAAATEWPLDRLREALSLPADALTAPLGAQAAGVRQRMLIAGALLAGHAAVVLQDPTRGLDAGERDVVLAALRHAATRGRAVLIAGLDSIEAVAVADRVLSLRGGRLLCETAWPLLDSAMLDALAMPPAAAERGASLLAEIARENDGAAFWALLRDDHVVCLGSAVAARDADPGLHAPRVARLEATRIPAALARRDPNGFVAEPDGSRRTLLTPLPPRRGRPMGWVGLTLGAAHAPAPPAAAVAFRVETLAAAL